MDENEVVQQRLVLSPYIRPAESGDAISASPSIALAVYRSRQP